MLHQRIRRIVLVLFCLLQTPVCAEAIQDYELYAGSAVLIEAQSGRVLYAKGAQEERAMASTTKIMTLLIALEEGRPEDRVAVSALAASQPEVNMNMKAGETYRMRDLLYAMMLQSYNDTAVAIAEHIAGSVPAFCALMNERALGLGALNTHFETANGLDSEGHYSTAYDMALIMREVIQNEEAVAIMKTRTHVIEPDEGHSRRIELVNRNPLFTVYGDSVVGKTGFTGKAGLCLVSAVKRDDTTLIAVVLASGWPPQSSRRVTDTRRLIDYGFDGFYMKDFLLDGTDTGESVRVFDGDKDAVATRIAGNFRYYVASSDAFRIDYDLPYRLNAPVREGDVVGEAVISINRRFVASLPVLAAQSAEKTDWRYYLRKLLGAFWRTTGQDL